MIDEKVVYMTRGASVECNMIVPVLEVVYVESDNRRLTDSTEAKRYV